MSAERITVNKERTSQAIGLCLEAREEQALIFSEEITPLERDFIQLLRDYSEEIGDERFLLNALFLTTAMVFASDTRRFFRGISDPSQLEKYAWIFMPEKVTRANEAEVIEACNEFFRPAGYNRRSIAEWTYNCKLLEEKYGGDLRNFFQEKGNSAQEVVDALVVYPRAKTEVKKAKGAFLRYGPKLSRLLVQWIHQYQLYEFKGAEEIGLPVDFQIGRIIIQTGGLELDGPAQAHHLAHQVLLPLLTSLCLENEWSSQEVSETLWLIGSLCCNQGNHDLCPVESMCDRLISRRSYDKRGLFDPTDIGRFKDMK